MRGTVVNFNGMRALCMRQAGVNKHRMAPLQQALNQCGNLLQILDGLQDVIHVAGHLEAAPLLP
jgi:hypothetical protein